MYKKKKYIYHVICDGFQTRKRSNLSSIILADLNLADHNIVDLTKLL